MPELPEVETIKNDLQQKILNKKILKVEIKLPKIVKNGTREFKKILHFNEFTNIQRRGKLLILELKNKQFVLVHLKMTGQLIYRDTHYGDHCPELPNKYSHVIFNFEDESRLFFNDIRQFGYIKLIFSSELDLILSKFGPEPLSKNFTLSKFKKLISSKGQKNIKALLLDQNIIAGIGNIYADEILFASNINVNRTSSSLSEKEISLLHQNIKKILKKAINLRGTTFSDYRDANGEKGNFIKFLQVYKREGHSCIKCNDTIKRIRIASRATRFCPGCQK